MTDALHRGWHVTTFNRGRSAPDIDGVQPVHGDRTKAADLARLAGLGPWDAVIDTSGYVPREVLAAAKALHPVTGQYVFISTVSVYAGWPVEPLSEDSEVLLCPPDAGPEFGEDTEDGPTRYGYQKSGCEAAVIELFGRDQSTILRPGVILGPREYVGRLPWWLRRVAEAGRVLAPGDPSRTIQPLDVRDLARFATNAAEQRISGVFNTTAPIGHATFGGLLSACAQVTGSDAEFVWVPDEHLISRGVRQWSEMPLWRTFPGVWAVDSSRAQNAGLHARDIEETAKDTWSWIQSMSETKNHDRAVEIGISREREQRILTEIAST